MTNPDESTVECTVVMEGQTMAAILEQLAYEIAEQNEDMGSVVILGILRRGRPLADRLARRLGELTKVTPPVGSLATTLYRDDLRQGIVPQVAVTPKGETHFEFDVNGRTVLLVDDVLAAGRTIRAAMDEVFDYGRPLRIQLACLIDRGGRELPIQPDYLGWRVATQPGEWVSVHLNEIDGEDCVLIERRQSPEELEGATPLGG